MKRRSSCVELTRTFVLTRVLICFAVIPAIRLLWKSNKLVDTSDKSFFVRSLIHLDQFDASQFSAVQQIGWQHEQNNAFNPFYPWMLSQPSQFRHWWSTSSEIGFKLYCVLLHVFPSTLVANFLVQTLIGYLNTLLMYKLGKQLLKSEERALVAAHLYVFSHSCVYQLSQYSESCFLLMTLLGVWFLLQRNGNPQTHQVVMAGFLFGLATITRATGVLLSIFIAYPMTKKILFTKNCCKIFKYLMASWLCAVFIFLPLFVIQYVKPYEMHCDTKIDRTNAVPVWCLDSFPSIYPYIQMTYWDNQFLCFLKRQPDNFLVAVPMFVITFAVTGRLLREVLFSRSFTHLTQDVMVPHAAYFATCMALILLYANTDINSRVASTIPVYYWTAACLVCERHGTVSLANFVLVHNLCYMLANFVIFPMEVGFV